MKMILDHDPVTGISHWVDTDESTGITTYGADQEVTPILEANRQDYNESHGKWGEWARVGSIPMTLWMQWYEEGIISDQKELKKRLNDIGFRNLRTRPGTL
jgi:hypothetical protein